MRIPLSWLNEYIDLSGLSVRDLSDKLTFSGVEVEGIETSGPVFGDKFVVGEVLECKPHPDSDHMHVCLVDAGEEKLGIVCGAPNCRAGLKVAVAKIGAVIPDGGFKIKAAKLRGVPSCGMLCSARELGLGSDHSGIMELDPSLENGSPLADALPKGETVFDLEITWNRSDCLSVIGIAREFSAILGRPLKRPDVSFPEEGDDVSSLAKVVVSSPDCLRYTARVVTGVKDGPSPDWMRSRLEAAGVRSLGLVVDVTNYVMLECGQPLHAFDHTTLKDNTIIVRQAADGETMKTLDGAERRLDSSMLVIADTDRAVAVAGIMGGLDTEITPSSRSVLIESALFAAPSVKKTATKLAIHSESSHRYERTVDPDLADWASRRAVSLLLKYGGGVAAKGFVDVDSRPPLQRSVTIDFGRVQRLIGTDPGKETMISILLSLGLEIESEGDGTATFKIPSWRVDLLEEADLAEEISRLYGLDKLPDVMPVAAIAAGVSDKPFRAEEALRRAVSSMGFHEAMHYSFLSAAELDAFEKDDGKRLVLPNPVSGDFAVMRPSLLPQLVQSLGRNYARQTEAPALFEIGRVFSRSGGEYIEEKRLSLGFAGPFGRDALSRRKGLSNEEAVLRLKGIVEAIAEIMHAPQPRFEKEDCGPFEKGFSLSVKMGKGVAGRIGLVGKAGRHAYRVNAPMAVAEIDLGVLLMNFGSSRALKPVAQYPAVMRDIALIVPASVTNGEIIKAIEKAAPKTLTRVSLFDIFKPKAAGEEKISLAYSLEFRSPDHTLKDEEVNESTSRIVEALKARLGAEVRQG